MLDARGASAASAADDPAAVAGAAVVVGSAMLWARAAMDSSSGPCELASIVDDAGAGVGPAMAPTTSAEVVRTGKRRILMKLPIDRISLPWNEEASQRGLEVHGRVEEEGKGEMKLASVDQCSSRSGGALYLLQRG
jgi:hypothetical protein